MKSSIIQKLAASSFLVLSAFAAGAQPILDNYIKEGLDKNIVLQQKTISLKQAEQSLQIARSYFLPSVSLLGDYTHGDGGRSIALPIGDLLNPVYSSLNQLTQGDNFKEVQNVEQTFFPQNFYDARIRTSLPLINTDLYIFRKINSQQLLSQGYEVDAYKRQLVLEIKTAYYNYLSAISAVKIYESSLELVSKNVEVNESLLKNGKSLPANVMRSRSEAEQVKAELNSAKARVSTARKYFNFLLNRDLNSEILEEQLPSRIAENGTDVSSQREELSMLKTAIEIQESTVELARLSRLPKVNVFFDIGSQASDWRFNNDSRYYLAGLQLSVPLFQGFRNNVQIRKSQLDVKRYSLELENTEARLEVAASIARENLATTIQNHQAALEQVKSARSYFHLIDKGYQQGVNSLIEYIDARSQLTSSELQLNLRQYEMLTAAAQLERETSSFNLPNN
jgi:outer membrane protein